MADNALVIGGNDINIIFGTGGSNDLDFATYFPNGVRLAGIDFIGAATDVLVLKNRSDSGKVVFQMVGTTYDSWAISVVKHLFLDYSAGTYAVPANCLAILHLA